MVLRGGGERLAGCGGAGTAHGDVVHLLGKGRYRGEIRAVRQSSGMAVVNRLGLEGYVKGCVPNEVPPEWPHAALRAQAVAARSYVLTQRRPGLFDVYDDTRSQVYGGAGTETDRTNAAVVDTEGKVVKHDGSIATTYYFSTSGGRTENSEFGFSGGSPRPYLKSVKRPLRRRLPAPRVDGQLQRERDALEALRPVQRPARSRSTSPGGAVRRGS